MTNQPPEDPVEASDFDFHQDPFCTCTSCGEEYDPHQHDRGICATCEDFAIDDFEEPA